MASIPAGSGVLVTASRAVEIFDNDIAANQTANVLLRAYLPADHAGAPVGADAHYDPYPRAIYIYGNRFSPGGRAHLRSEWRHARSQH